ncbi:MAG: aromatic amino acid transaminase [Gammaproteobacteria bacterium]|nr:aromatic amino acid transaminase [Gammaproteobacteria bacterium]
MSFENLTAVRSDSVLGLATAFLRDKAAGKIDLTVGVYRNDQGRTPVMNAVAEAERAIIAAQTTKSYLPPIGPPGYRARIRRLVLGDLDDGLGDRTGVLQTTGGCGALRIGAELFARAQPGKPVYLSDPTWGNHDGLMSGAGLRIRTYPYFDASAHALRLDEMLDCLKNAPEHSLIVLQSSCHNPTGADPAPDAWAAILDTVERCGHLPFFDVAYQGLGTGLREDVLPVHMAAGRLGEFLVAVSCSKNFGLYRERCGALLMVTPDGSRKGVVESQVKDIARGMYSMAPSHGALIVDRVLSDSKLRSAWRRELAGMSKRLAGLRTGLARAMDERRPDLDFSWIARHKGLFLLPGIEPAAVDRLREENHIYMIRDGRINIAGLNKSNLATFADALAPLL